MKNAQFLKNILKFSIFLGLGIFITWWFVRDLSAEYRELIFDSFRNANYKFVGIALLFGLFSFWIRAKRWKMQMQPMGYFPKTKNVVMAVLVGYFANLAFPRLGEVVRCGLLDKHENIPTAKSIGTVITERALDTLCFLTLLFVTLAVEFEHLSELAMEHFSGFYERITDPKFMRNVALFSGLGILTLGVFIFFLRKKIAHTRVYRQVRILILYFWQGLISLKDMKKRWLFITYTVGLWVCYYLMAYIVFFAVAETSNLPMSAGLACMVFGTIGIVITPGGIGLYPVIIASTLFLYGIAEPIGFALGWLIWTSQNLIVVIGGILALVLMPMINRKTK